VSSSQSDFLRQAGVLNTFSGGEQRTWPAHLKLGEPFALLEPGFERKRYACCYLLHKVIAIGIDIARAGIELSGIEQICVEMPRGGTKPLLHPRPATGMEALFSGPYSLLAAIADGGISLSSFTDAAVQRPHIQSRLSAVELIETGPALETSGDLDSAPVTVRVKLTSGATRSFVRHAAPGSSEDPLSLAELAEKWRECLARANTRLGTERAFELFAGRACLQQRASVEPWLSALWEASSDLASASAPALE
jgi:2-methylcitrate dehydratase PrpD